MWLCHKRRYSKMTFMITSLFCIRLKFSLSYHRDSTELSLSFTGPSPLWRALAAWPCYQSKVVATMPLCPWHGTEPTNIHFRKRSVFLHMILIDLRMHHEFCRVNIIDRSWRTWQTNRMTSTLPYIERSNSSCFQVQPVICCNLLVFLFNKSRCVSKTPLKMMDHLLGVLNSNWLIPPWPIYLLLH